MTDALAHELHFLRQCVIHIKGSKADIGPADADAIAEAAKELYSLARDAKPACLCRDEKGYICCEPAGHEGDHVAKGTLGVYSVWSQQ